MKSIKFTQNSQITQFDKSQPLSNYISQVPDNFSLKSILKTTQPKIKTPRHHPYRPSVATPLTVTSYTTHSSRFSKPESDHDETDKLSQLSIDFGENSESDNDLNSKFHKDSFSRVLEKLSNRPSKLKNSEAIEKIKKGIAKYFFKDRNCLEFVDFINGNPKVIQGPRLDYCVKLDAGKFAQFRTALFPAENQHKNRVYELVRAGIDTSDKNLEKGSFGEFSVNDNGLDELTGNPYKSMMKILKTVSSTYRKKYPEFSVGSNTSFYKEPNKQSRFCSLVDVLANYFMFSFTAIFTEPEESFDYTDFLQVTTVLANSVNAAVESYSNVGNLHDFNPKSDQMMNSKTSRMGSKIFTYRSIYYKDVDLWQNEQSNLMRKMKSVFGCLNINPRSLNIKPSVRAKLSYNGVIEMIDSDLPLKHHPLYILVVEKDTIFQKLTNSEYLINTSCLLITSSGFPTYDARKLILSYICHQQCPVFVLTDGDASGLNIFFSYVYGGHDFSVKNSASYHSTSSHSKNPWYQDSILPIEHVFWIGLKPYRIPYKNDYLRPSVLPENDLDHVKIKNMLENKRYIEDFPETKTTLKLLLKIQARYELEILEEFGSSMMLEYYIFNEINLIIRKYVYHYRIDRASVQYEKIEIHCKKARHDPTKTEHYSSFDVLKFRENQKFEVKPRSVKSCTPLSKGPLPPCPPPSWKSRKISKTLEILRVFNDFLRFLGVLPL